MIPSFHFRSNNFEIDLVTPKNLKMYTIVNIQVKFTRVNRSTGKLMQHDLSYQSVPLLSSTGPCTYAGSSCSSEPFTFTCLHKTQQPVPTAIAATGFIKASHRLVLRDVHLCLGQFQHSLDDCN